MDKFDIDRSYDALIFVLGELELIRTWPYLYTKVELTRQALHEILMSYK